MGKRQRADVLLVERGLAESRTRAQALLLGGKVFARGDRVDKPGTLLDVDTPLEVRGEARFVSRGGEKLDGALEDLGLDVEGAAVADVGASTGGFTDCVLQRGARRVYAIDVGRGLLHPRVRADPRVVVMEGINARYVPASGFDEAPGLVLVDASFISLGTLAPVLASWLPVGGRLLALMKPQFEVGREVASRGRGVVRTDEERELGFARVRAALDLAGLERLEEVDARLAGPKGNRERFVLARRG